MPHIKANLTRSWPDFHSMSSPTFHNVSIFSDVSNVHQFAGNRTTSATIVRPDDISHGEKKYSNSDRKLSLICIKYHKNCF